MKNYYKNRIIHNLYKTGVRQKKSFETSKLEYGHFQQHCVHKKQADGASVGAVLQVDTSSSDSSSEEDDSSR